jgi:hypothetical protein
MVVTFSLKCRADLAGFEGAACPWAMLDALAISVRDDIEGGNCVARDGGKESCSSGSASLWLLPSTPYAPSRNNDPIGLT